MMLERLIGPAAAREALPRVGMGTWATFDAAPGAACAPLVDGVRELQAGGGRVIDTSPMYSLATRAAESRLRPYCQERGIAVLVNRPFEEGELLRRLRGRALPSDAAELGCADWAPLCLKFIISHPAVSCVIPASAAVAYVRRNLQAGSGALPDAELRRRMVVDAGVWAGGGWTVWM
jgi:diketogulonate reductase-like aldo/keto reductase